MKLLELDDRIEFFTFANTDDYVLVRYNGLSYLWTIKEYNSVADVVLKTFE